MRVLHIPAMVVALLVPAAAWAQETIEFKGSGWVNAKDISLDRLKGKVVFVYFVEETWPTCTAKIPGRNQLRNSFIDKPVVFLAVISGNPRSVVEQYAKSHKFEWPIFVDEFRETEKALGFTISLQNIYECFIVDPAGKVRRAAGEDKAIADEINKLLPQAKLTFDGIAVPEKLKALARDLELGQYDPALGDLVALAQKSPKDETLQAMVDRFKSIAEAGLERARTLEGEGRKYAAYLEYAKVASWFRKTEFEKAGTAGATALKKDKEVQDEIAARQMLDQAKALLASTKKADKEAAPSILQSLQKKYPNTEAAREAAKLAK